MNQHGESSSVTHEPEGTRIYRVIAVAGGLLLVLIVAHSAVWWFFQGFYPFAPGGVSTPGKPTKPLAVPQLQANPIQDLEQWRAAQEARLHSYGWIDREAKMVRIPIERAMELLVERDSGVSPPAEAKHE